MKVFVRGISIAAIAALGLAGLSATPAVASAPRAASVASDAPVGDVTPSSPSDDVSTQDYAVTKRGSKLTVSNKESTESSLAVRGTIFEIAAEIPGAPTTFLMLDSGTSVPLDIDLPDGISSGATFAGTLSLTPEVTDDLGVQVSEAAPIASSSDIGELVTDAAVDTETELPVEQGSFTAAPKTSALGGTSREINVAFVRPASGYSTATISDAHLTTMVTTAEDYWVRESAGVISGFTIPAADSNANGTGHFPIIQSAYNCTSSTAAVNMWTTAWTNYKANVYSTAASPFSFVVVVPHGACENRAGFIGLGNVGNGFGVTGEARNSPSAPLQAYSSTLIDARSLAADTGGVLIHELGHNFGLGHSDLFGCTSSSYIDYKYSSGKSCATYDYYDLFDPMGFEVSKPGVLSAANKFKLGVLDEDVDYTPISAGLTGYENPVDVTLSPISDDTGMRAVIITDPLYGKTFFVEYRSGTGADANAAYKTEPDLQSNSTGDTWSLGTGVRVLKDYSDGDFGDDVLELASMPDGNDPDSRALAMPVHDGFSPYGGRFDVDVVSETATEAVVRITLHSSHLLTPKLSGPQLSGTATVGSTITFGGLKNWQTPALTVSKTWLRGGQSICGATGNTYTLRSYDDALPITVKTTAKRTGLPTTSYSTPAKLISGTATTASPKPSLTLTRNARQSYGSSMPVSAIVTIDGALAGSGTLTMIHCSDAVVEGVAIDPDGTTTIPLPNSLAIGTISMRAIFVPTPGSAALGSISAYKKITVIKGTVKPTLTVSTTSAPKHTPVTLTATMPMIGDTYPGGKVRFYVNGTYVGYDYLSAGTASIDWASGKAGKKSVTAKFYGTSILKPATSSAKSLTITP
jgi:hypothetical protein